MNLSFRLFYNSKVRFDKYLVGYGRYNSSQTTTSDDITDITSVDEVPQYENKITEEDCQKIMAKRNKSRLTESDRNKLFHLPPFNNQDLALFHKTIRFKQRMLGRYGMKGLNVSAGALWPLEEEILDRLEFEKVVRPHTVQEGWAIIAQRNHENAEAIRLREEEIAANLAKVDQWRQELQAKIAKREANARAIKERKERIIEEVRRQFGYNIDPRDVRFQQALAQKEKEDKKRKKEAKKQAREERLMARLMQESIETKTQPTHTESTENKEK